MKQLALVGALAAGLMAAWLWLGPEAQKAPGQSGLIESDAPTIPAGPILRGEERPASVAEGGSGDPASPASDNAGEMLLAKGRVLDRQRRPVAGAAIAVHAHSRLLASAESDENGAFSLTLGAVPPTAIDASIEARKGSRRARASLYLRPRMPLAFHLRTLVLGPTHVLDVLVVAQGAPVPGARVVVMDAKDTLSTGRLAEGRTNGQGRLQLDGLGAPNVLVFAHAKGHGRGKLKCALPRDGGPVQVQLPRDRALDVLVKHAEGGEPVEGAEVFVAGGGTMNAPRGTGCLPALPPLRTDESGHVRVTGLPPGRLDLVARAPRLGPLSQGFGPERVAVAPEATEAEVLLHPYRALRFPIGPSSVGAPPEGTLLEIVRYQPVAGYDDGSVTARVEDEHVVLEPFPPAFDLGHVLAPDGRWASFSAPDPRQAKTLKEVFFRPSRDVAVRLTTTDGQVLAGEWLRLLIRPRGRRPAQRTDELGMVTFPQLQGKTATVLWSSEQLGFGTRVASVNLGSPADITEAVVETPVPVRIALTLDGGVGLPAAYRVYAPVTDPGQAGRMRAVSEVEIEEDAEIGEITFHRLGPSGKGPFPITIEAKGYVSVTLALARSADGTWRGTAALRKATLLIVRIVPPEDGRWHVMLERWNDESQDFFPAPDDSSMRPIRGGSREVQRYEGLRPDRYRLRELVTKHTSEPFEVKAGGGDIAIPFDLGAIVLIKGTVLLPEGEDAAFAEVRVDRAAEPGRMPDRPIRVGADGQFVHRALRGSRVRFKVTHPLLRPAPEGGAQEILVGQEAPTLKLERGVEVQFRIEGSDFTTTPPSPNIYYSGPSFSGPVQVRAAKVEAWTPETPAVPALARQGTFRIALDGPGRWTLRVEVDGHVPFDLTPVEIKAGPNNLGTLHPQRGARVRLNLHAIKSALPRFIQAKALFLGKIPYTRTAWKVEQGDPSWVLLEGLGPGRFRVTLTMPEEPQEGQPGGAPGRPKSVKRFDQEIDSDGEHEIVLDVHLP